MIKSNNYPPYAANLLGPFSLKFLATKSIRFEQKILKENVGSQDQIAAAYGGFNSIKFYQNNTFHVNSFKSKKFIKKLSKNLILVYTGINRTAHRIASSYVFDLNKKNKNIKNS